jgi:zinc transport system substrate-binding protein
MNLVRRLAPTALAAATLALAGCGALSDGDTSASGASDRPTVVAALYPLQYVAQRVAGAELEVTNLTAAGGEPHELELGLRETALVTDSDLLLHIGTLQPAVDEAAENAGGEVLDAATVVDLLPFAQEHAEHDESAEHDEHAEHAEHDPHFWQDPLRMADLGDAVARRLAEVDPARAEAFTDNAAALRGDLEALDQEFLTGLARCERTTVVTNHDAFGYLEKYGLELRSIAGISPEAEPSPATLAELQTLIAADGITTVFSESLVSPKTAQVLADDAGVRTDVLDTVEGLTDATAEEDYLSLMRANLAALQEANGC